MTLDLFDSLEPTEQRQEQLAAGAVVLRAFALPYVQQLLPALALIGLLQLFKQI